MCSTNARPSNPYFNSRPCVRGNDHKDRRLRYAQNFNSRPCVRGNYIKTMESTSLLAFQFTPLREGQLHHRSLVSALAAISIHAPA